MADDMKSEWQQQPTDPFATTIDSIREKAAGHRAKTRAELVKTFTTPLIVAACWFFCAKEFPSRLDLLQSLCALALLWSLAGLYFLNRGKWSDPLSSSAGLTAGLQFCRREIELRRQHSLQILIWGFGPALLSLTATILGLVRVAGSDLMPKGLPFLTLAAVWICLFLFINRVRTQRQLTHEIKELNALEKLG